jgi:hypothetical protein
VLGVVPVEAADVLGGIKIDRPPKVLGRLPVARPKLLGAHLGVCAVSCCLCVKVDMTRTSFSSPRIMLPVVGMPRVPKKDCLIDLTSCIVRRDRDREKR